MVGMIYTVWRPELGETEETGEDYQATSSQHAAEQYVEAGLHRDGEVKVQVKNLDSEVTKTIRVVIEEVREFTFTGYEDGGAP